jgi:hypothetical protein
VPSPLASFLRAYDIKLADDMGWAKFQNGQLLSAAEREGFHVLLSGDQTIKYEQSMAGRKIAVVSMSDNHWPIVRIMSPLLSRRSRLQNQARSKLYSAASSCR